MTKTQLGGWVTFPLADHRHKTYTGTHAHSDLGEPHRHPQAGTSFLCRLGRHNWNSLEQDITQFAVTRQCRRCPLKQARSYTALLQGDTTWQPILPH